VVVGINGAKDKGYLEGEHTLMFINKDGQASCVTFPVDALKIDSIVTLAPIPAAPNNRILKDTGNNFCETGHAL
jgi:hypothetical protein